MQQFYELEVAGLKRNLPLCKVTDDLYIGAFVIFGDVELTVNSAKALLKLAPEHDIMITAESKGIPLIYEMARQSGENKYLIARKAPKLYMKNVVSTEVTSITTAKKQMLYIDSEVAVYSDSGRKKFICIAACFGKKIHHLLAFKINYCNALSLLDINFYSRAFRDYIFFLHNILLTCYNFCLNISRVA